MSKIALISDIHIGQTINRTDIDTFHEIHINYAKWLANILDKNGISNIGIAGDFFHDRSKISLTTLDVGHTFLDILRDKNIVISTGNHDCYYLDNSSINALSVFKTRKNVTIVDQKVEEIDGITYCPWGTTIDQIPDNSRIVAGHWDAASFEMQGGKICTHGIKVADLMEKCQIAFSGHFHKTQKRVYGGKTFRYLGSVCQLSFGESGNNNYVHILDTDTLKVSQIRNDASPIFKYVRSESDIVDIKNNFISIVSDDDELKQKILSNQPKFLKTELVDIIKTSVKDSTEDLTVSEFKLVNVPDVIEDFVERIDNTEWNLTDDERKTISQRMIVSYKQFEN